MAARSSGKAKKGDRYLRSLLVTAPWTSYSKQIRPNKHPGVAKLLGRMSPKQAAIAIAMAIATFRISTLSV